jgi:hypothetical protein
MVKLGQERDFEKWGVSITVILTELTQLTRRNVPCGQVRNAQGIDV